VRVDAVQQTEDRLTLRRDPQALVPEPGGELVDRLHGRQLINNDCHLTPRHDGVAVADAPSRICNGTSLHAAAVAARAVTLNGDRNLRPAREIAELREVERTCDARIDALAQ
jgi:hypothetical protein